MSEKYSSTQKDLGGSNVGKLVSQNGSKHLWVSKLGDNTLGTPGSVASQCSMFPHVEVMLGYFRVWAEQGAGLVFSSKALQPGLTLLGSGPGPWRPFDSSRASMTHKRWNPGERKAATFRETPLLQWLQTLHMWNSQESSKGRFFRSCSDLTVS